MRICARVVITVLMAGTFFLLWLPTAGASSLQVGVLLPLSGNLAPFGRMEKRAFEMAARDINRSGGIHGSPLELRIRDTKGSRHTGLRAAEQLISEDGILALSGCCSSTVAWEASKAAQKQRIPLLVNTASADKITEQGWEYVFRLNPPASEYHDSLTSFLRRVARPEKVAVLFEDSPSGRFGWEEVSGLCRRLGFKVVMRYNFRPGRIDFSRILIKLRAELPDIVFVVADAEHAARILREADRQAYRPDSYVGWGTKFSLPEFPKKAGANAGYLFSPTLWAPSLPYSGADGFYRAFVERFGSAPDYHGAQAYAALQVIQGAIIRSSALTRSAIRDAMAKTDQMTVYGPVRFVNYDKKTHQNKLATPIIQWIDGNPETVWPPHIASARYIYPVPD